jgi:hypothetical protein
MNVFLSFYKSKTIFKYCHACYLAKGLQVYVNYCLLKQGYPVPVASRSPAEIVGSNPTGGMEYECCVCCQVQVSATSWSLVQRSPTDCGASLCVI